MIATASLPIPGTFVDWIGSFGDAYTERNAKQPDRRAFWSRILERCQPRSVLEPGANRGFNLHEIKNLQPQIDIWATDVNKSALRVLRKRMPRINAVFGDLRHLPFADNLADLVFTVGVLIHIPPEQVPGCILELTRCSKRYILICEYASETVEEVEYRGQRGLWRAPFGRIAESTVAALRRLDSGFLGRDQGFDQVTWWLYEKGCHSSGPP